MLTHNATSLILPGGANITTQPNAAALLISLGTGNWWCAIYQDPTNTFTSAILDGTLNISQAMKFTGVISPAQITANQNDYAPPDFQPQPFSG